jgi:hypothetical protein
MRKWLLEPPGVRPALSKRLPLAMYNSQPSMGLMPLLLAAV